ncbi:MAG: ribosome recycling factor [Bacteroidales bacterium]|jgi:ribosome recycling factor|nr:ribosome recycling factor [Bacteroidales bacterium]MDD4703153.1 ribosome recycling factor [Bacteroidales bacterium]MDX9797633.1 ribosome recycling factor [Bacteroidales bacterium]
MTDLSKHLIEECKTNMQGAIKFLEGAMHKIRAGKASPTMLEGIKVDYYGNPTPLEQVANISTPDPKQLVIQPWEKTMLSPIDKAILAANLGFTPKFEGDILRIVLPPVTEERRRELVKRAKSEVEESKVSIRNVRRGIIDKVKKSKDQGVSEDEIKVVEKEIEQLTEKFIKETETVLSVKEKEIMSI